MVNRKKTAKRIDTKRGRGRPPTGRQRPGMIGVRVSEEERAAIEAAAAAAGETPGNWLRGVGLAAATR